MRVNEDLRRLILSKMVMFHLKSDTFILQCEIFNNIKKKESKYSFLIRKVEKIKDDFFEIGFVWLFQNNF